MFSSQKMYIHPKCSDIALRFECISAISSLQMLRFIASKKVAPLLCDKLLEKELCCASFRFQPLELIF